RGHGHNERTPASRVGLPELPAYNAAKLPLTRATRISPAMVTAYKVSRPANDPASTRPKAQPNQPIAAATVTKAPQFQKGQRTAAHSTHFATFISVSLLSNVGLASLIV